jgi:hybrid cluster-associated redox disulfide protein
MLHPAGQRKRVPARSLPYPGSYRGAMSRFRKEMSIFEALQTDAEARDVFESHGMSCCLCIGAQSESIEAGAILHQVDPDVVIAELNRLTGAGS